MKMMERILRRWRGAGGRRARTRGTAGVPLLGAGGQSARPEGMPGGLGAGWNEFLPLPGNTPFEMLGVYRMLRDAVPDISDAVWTWKRLCQTGHRVEIADAASARDGEEARGRIAELDRRVNGGAGMTALLDLLYAALFTYGAAAVELVPGRERSRLHDAVPVDVWTLRFRRESGRLLPFQVFEGDTVPLPEARILYLGLDRDGTNPYGRSMLRSIPFVVKIQQQLLEDMAKAAHNAGWSRLHVRCAPEPRLPGEDAGAHRARAEAALASLRESLTGLKADQNIVTYDNVSVSVVQGDQRTQVFYDNHKAVEEQVITALHMMPVLMGRNYGSTETYGTAQFEVVNRQVQTVNRLVGGLLERIYNTELALGGVAARAVVRMNENRTVDTLKEAEARGRDIENTLRLRDAGLIGDGAARETLGLR